MRPALERQFRSGSGTSSNRKELPTTIARACLDAATAPRKMRSGAGSSVVIDPFIEISLSCKTAGELFDRFRAALQQLGFDRIVFSLMTDHLRQGLFARHGIASNYPQDWMRHYMASGYEDMDPVRQWVVTADGPFCWRDPVRARCLSPAQRNLLDQGEEAGLKDGIGIPLRGANGALAGIGAASSSGRLGLTPALLGRANLLAQQFYVAYLVLHAPRHTLAPVVLSEPEREVLKWSAGGKSKREIAEILGVSRHTIDYHCRRMLVRLDVPNVTAAVMRAVQVGALQL
jgi:DNA-binding CsgD family transcriptional regulator